MKNRTTSILIVFGLATVFDLVAQTGPQIAPGIVERGKSQTFVVSAESPCKLKGAVAKSGTTGVKVTSSSYSDLGCSLVFDLATTNEAPYGRAPIPLVYKDGTVATTVFVEVSPVLPGPIPPGLDPQVDVMWKILPYKNVADSFGRKVANQYFAIEVSLGNNTGYTLQLASIGFECLPGQSKESLNAACAPMPNDAYHITRSTIERDRETGARAIFLNTLSLATGVFATMGGFFGNHPNPHLTSNQRYSIFLAMASPLASGFALLFPDKTVRHLIGLDTRTFRESMLIPNNTQQRILTFMSRELWEGEGDSTEIKCCSGCKNCTQRVQRKRDSLNRPNGTFNPLEIMARAGRLVIVGHQIDYLQRVRVVSGNVPVLSSPPVVSSPISISLAQDAGSVTRILTGNSLDGVAVSFEPQVEGLSATIIPNADGKSAELKVTVAAMTKTGDTTLVLSKQDLLPWRIPFKITSGKAEVNPPADPASVEAGKSKDFEVAGKFLTGAKCVSPDPLIDCKVNPNSDTGFKLVVKVSSAAKPADYKLSLEFPNGRVDYPLKVSLGKITATIEFAPSNPKVTDKVLKVNILKGEFLSWAYAIFSGPGITPADVKIEGFASAPQNLPNALSAAANGPLGSFTITLSKAPQADKDYTLKLAVPGYEDDSAKTLVKTLKFK